MRFLTSAACNPVCLGQCIAIRNLKQVLFYHNLLQYQYIVSTLKLCSYSCVMVHHRTPYAHSGTVQWHITLSMKVWWGVGTKKTYCCEKAETEVTHCRSPASSGVGEKAALHVPTGRRKSNQMNHLISITLEKKTQYKVSHTEKERSCK